MKKTITVLLMALCSTMLMAQNVQNVKHNYNYKGKVSFEKPVDFKAPFKIAVYDSISELNAAVPTPQNGYMAISLDTGLVAYVYGSWISLNKNNNNNSYAADTPFILSQVVFNVGASDEFICSATILGSDSFRCEYCTDWQFSSNIQFMSNYIQPNAFGSYVFHRPGGIAEGTYYVRLVNIATNKPTNAIRVVVPNH